MLLCIWLAFIKLAFINYLFLANNQDILNDGGYLPPPPPGITNIGTLSQNGQWTNNHHGPPSIVSYYYSN